MQQHQQIPPTSALLPPPVADWLVQCCVAWPKPVFCFPISMAVYQHQIFLSAHTQNRQLSKHEEIFVYWLRVNDCTFKWDISEMLNV